MVKVSLYILIVVVAFSIIVSLLYESSLICKSPFEDMLPAYHLLLSHCIIDVFFIALAGDIYCSLVGCSTTCSHHTIYYISDDASTCSLLADFSQYLKLERIFLILLSSFLFITRSWFLHTLISLGTYIHEVCGCANSVSPINRAAIMLSELKINVGIFGTG